MSNETVSLEVAIEVVLRNGPTFETIAGLCKMAVEAERKIIMDSLQKQADLATDALDRRWALEMIAAVAARSRT
jgi:hypothetical protein